MLSGGWWLQGGAIRAFPKFSLHFKSTHNPGSRNCVAEEDFSHFQGFFCKFGNVDAQHLALTHCGAAAARAEGPEGGSRLGIKYLLLTPV